MSPCINHKELTDWQYDRLLGHIRDNQYFLGEKLGRYVDWTDAEHDFFEYYCADVCKLLRFEYCGHICKFFNTCELGHKLLSE